MAVLKNPQRAQQLVVKQRLLKSGLRERRDRTENIPRLRATAKRGFDAPDADQNGLIDAVLVLHRAQSLGPLRGFALPHADPRGRNEAAEISAHRLTVFRFAPHGGENVWIGRQSREGDIEGRARDAFMSGLGPQRVEKSGEGRGILAKRGEAADVKSGEACQANRENYQRETRCSHPAAACASSARISCR